MITRNSTNHAAFLDGRSARRGFTLIELLVVIAIIVILVAVSVPVLSKLSQSNKRTQAVNLASAYIANARALAIQYKRPAAVVFYEQISTNAGSIRNANQTAVMLALADIDQTQYSPAAGNIVFTPIPGRGPEHMPAGIKIAALDNGVNVVRTTDSSGAKTRAIVFDAQGQLVLRNGLAVPTVAGSAGSSTKITGDWNFLSPPSALPGSSANGVSTPGVIIYDGRDYTENVASGTEAAKALWLQKNADILIVNAYTGNLLR